MRAILIAALFILATGCLPVVYAKWEPVSLDQKDEKDKRYIIVPGNWVRMHTGDDKIYMLKVTQTDDQGLYGIARDDKKYRVQYADLASIEILRADVDMTPPIRDAGRLAYP